MGFGSKAFIFIALYDVWDLKCWIRRHHCLVAFQGSQSFVPEARITETDGLSTYLNDLGSVKATQLISLNIYLIPLLITYSSPFFS